VRGEEKRLDELKQKCDDARRNLQSLNEEAEGIRASINTELNDAQSKLSNLQLDIEKHEHILSDVIQRTGKENKENEAIKRDHNRLVQEIVELEEKAKNAKEEEKRAISAAISSENQYDAVMKRIRSERDAFEKSMQQKKKEFKESHVIIRNQLEQRVRDEMEQICDGYFDTFEEVSSILSRRFDQIEDLVLRMESFKSDFGKWKEEKQKLTQDLSDSINSRDECRAQLETTKAELEVCRNERNKLSASIKQIRSSYSKLEQEKSSFQSQLMDMEKQLAEKSAELEAAELSHQIELDRATATRSSLIDQQTRKLRELMNTMTLQEDKLNKKQNAIEQKEESLLLRETKLEEESQRNEDCLRSVRGERESLEELRREIDDSLLRQENKEEELIAKSKLLKEKEENLNKKQEDIKAGQKRIKELAVQLQKRNEEVEKQRKLLQERLQRCDEYEAQLSAWEKQLDDMATMLETKEGEA